MDDDRSASTEAALPRIKLPDLSPPTLEEVERRRVLVAKAQKIREEIGPIGVRVEDLIHQLRGGDDRFDK